MVSLNEETGVDMWDLDEWLARLRRDAVLLAALAAVAAFALSKGVAPVYALALLVLLAAIALLRGDVPAARAGLDEPVLQGEDQPALAALIDRLDLPVLLVSRAETVLLQNASAEALFGPLPEGAPVSARLRAPGLLDMVRRVMESSEPDELDYVERIPVTRAFRVRATPLDGTRFVVTFTDRSGLHRMDQMRTDFVANASHELRTPLASLRGFIETLQGPARSDPKAQERFLGIMLDQVTRMSRLVDDLLSLSRLEIKSHVAPEAKVDLVPLVGHVIATLQPLAESLDVAVTFTAPKEQVIIRGDKDELQQVFENLIENACKYGQEGKAVEVEISTASPDGPEVSITDHGPGIEAQHVPRLTERFYRVNVEASRSKKGTGLGLAIVKHILNRHKARLVIASEPGKGSRFCVRF